MLGTIKHAERYDNGIGIARIDDVGIGFMGKAHDLVIPGISTRYGDINTLRNGNDMGGFDACLSCLGVGSHESSGTQESSSEVAGCYYCYIC